MGNSVWYTSDGRSIVTGRTALTPKDTLRFILSSNTSFAVPIISFIVFKIQNGKKYAVSIEKVGLQPGTKAVRNMFLGTDLVKRFGYGDFLVQFTSGEEVLAEGSYSMKTQ